MMYWSAFESYIGAAARCGVGGGFFCWRSCSLPLRIPAELRRSRSRFFAVGEFRWHGKRIFCMVADDSLHKLGIVSSRANIWIFFSGIRLPA